MYMQSLDPRVEPVFMACSIDHIDRAIANFQHQLSATPSEKRMIKRKTGYFTPLDVLGILKE
ncbi:MAG: hypothetical protein DKT66_21270 [Candidatus Melainabacteria bacterium]|nr:MAG: hypothetical protein DKT66_21270 [Candidatus Melainabacteria bacterium]